jgi:uncharacterized damage-inducible protein DinB
MTVDQIGPSTPVAGREEVFVRYLDSFRERIIAKVGELSEEEIRRSRVPSGWTPLQLVKHLRFVELRWIVWGFEGGAVDEPWGDWRDDHWYAAPEESREDLVAALRAQGGETRRVVESTDLATVGVPSERWDGDDPPTLERILFHLLQEYAHHAGHLDIVAELAGQADG